MQFCSIDEAWGGNSFEKKPNKTKEHFRPLNDNTDNFNKDDFINEYEINKKDNRYKVKDVTDIDIALNNKNDNCDKKHSCNTILEHIRTCPSCRRKIKKELFSNLYNTIRSSIEEYREPIILILVAIFIILLINLIIKI